MRRPAFTLIETLITIALLVLLAAVALPNIGGRVAERRFRDAQRRVELAALMCRAEATRTAGARLLVAREDADGLWRFYADPPAAESHEPVGDGLPEMFDADAWAPQPSRESLLELPEGCSIAIEPPAAQTDKRLEPIEPPEPSLERPPEFVGGEPEPAPSFRLAAFLPDGRAVTPAELYLLGPGGRVASIHISLWTGSARVEPIVPEPAEGTLGQPPDLPPPPEPER